MRSDAIATLQEYGISQLPVSEQADGDALEGFVGSITEKGLLDRAFATAPAGSGPHMTQAALAFGLHRLGEAEAALNAIDRYAVRAEVEIRSEAQATRGDIAFYRGDYAQALQRYQHPAGDAEAGDAVRLAIYHSKTGHPDEALKDLDRAQRQMRFPSAQSLANLDLQRGAIELQRGAWDRAGAM